MNAGQIGAVYQNGHCRAAPSVVRQMPGLFQAQAGRANGFTGVRKE